jgi:hypothetical protein
MLFLLLLSDHNFYQRETDNNQKTFIPNCFGTPADLEKPYDSSQLAQVNILQQAFKELLQSKYIYVQSLCTSVLKWQIIR